MGLSIFSTIAPVIQHVVGEKLCGTAAASNGNNPVLFYRLVKETQVDSVVEHCLGRLLLQREEYIDHISVTSRSVNQ